MKDNIKFIRNIVITITALIIVAIIINFTPGYKREKYNDITNLVYGKENMTQNLRYKICFNKDKIYISRRDVEELIIKEKNLNLEYTMIEDVEYIELEDIISKFNLNAEYIQESNILIIDDLNVALKSAKVIENASLQFKARKLSKVVGEVQENEEVTYFDNQDINGWIKIRTGKGEIGYIEESKIIKMN